MTVSKKRVTSREVDDILDLEESHFRDLKSRDISPAKLSKSIAAFANSDGGELFIGVSEDSRRCREWYGFDRIEDANGHLQAFENLFPLGDHFDYDFLEVASSSRHKGLVLHVTIQKGSDIKYATDRTAYIRRGGQNIPVQTDESLDILRRNKGITTFETETVAVPTESVANSETMITFMLSLVPIAEPLPWLRKQLLVQAGKPSVAGVLLFSDEPQAALPKRSAIKLYRYKTTDLEGSREKLDFDPITIEGSAYEQIDKAVSRTVEVIEGIHHLGPQGLETIRYPFETLHEIITNAVLHRDYAVADDVHVRIFDNRVEVESPGRLPAHITENNFLEERFSRNGNIVRIINKFPNPPNKDIGEGLNTAFAAMKNLQLKDPLVEQLENSVLVTIRHQRLASPEQMIMEYLDNFSEITNKTVRDLTGIGSENKVKTIFYQLAKRNQIERVPGKGGGYAAWQKCSGGEVSEEGDP